MRREMKKENGGVARRGEMALEAGQGVGGWREEGAWVGMWERGVRVALRAITRSLSVNGGRERETKGKPEAQTRQKQRWRQSCQT